MAMKLDIYIEPDCQTCQHAIEMADVVRRKAPDVQVSVIDITKANSHTPASVFAVPTYILNGKRISLGNPTEPDLLAQLQSDGG